MEVFLRSQNNTMWSVIETGEYTPMKDANAKPQAE
jgi:hypothetical protein